MLRLNMIRPSLFVLLLPVVTVANSTPRVENVRASQRPRSNTVEVFYDLVAPEGDVYDVSLAIGGGGVEPPLSTVGGDIGADIIPGRNKRIEWDAGADWAQHVQSNFVATVTATRADTDTGPSKGMVRIPGGTNNGTDPDFGSYSLTVDSFYMDKTEVTYAHWKRVYSWAIAHGYDFDHPGSGKGGKHPVHSVSWYDCVKWCNARSEMEGHPPAYRVDGEVYRTGQSNPDTDLDGSGYRLPTTTEWQYAARGGLHGKRFPWGDTISHSRANDCYHPRYSGDSQPYTLPVGSFAPNRYGLYDMAGNLSEWCTNASGSDRCFLGGDWSMPRAGCQCGYAPWTLADYADSRFGFRSVRRR